MIQVSNDFIQALNEPSRMWRARLLYNGQDTGATVKSILTKGGSNSETAFVVGGVYSVFAEVIIDTASYEWEEKLIELQLGLVLANDTTEWITLGNYTINEVEAGKYVTTIRGIGTIATKFNGSFTAPEPQTVTNIINALQTQTGATITIDSSFSGATVVERNLEGLVNRDVLQIVTAILGGFATDKNDGTVIIAKYPSVSTLAVGGDRMIIEPVFNDYDTEITGVKVIVSEGFTMDDGTVVPEVAYQTPTYNITIYNSYMTEAAFNAFANALVGLSWRKAMVYLALGDPRIEATDLLTVTIDGTSYIVPCHHFEHRFDGGLQTDIYSNGEISKGTATDGQIEQVAQRALIVASDALTQIENLEIGGVNLLLDTNAPSLDKVYADKNRYFSNSDVTQITGSIVEITDAPVDVQYGARLQVTAITPTVRDKDLAWYNGSVVKMNEGETYTLSAYYRITSGTSAFVSMLLGVSSYTLQKRFEIANTEWKRYSYTFEYSNEKTGGTDGARAYIGITAQTLCTVEICGFQLEQGTKATAYNRNSELEAQIQEVNNYFWHDTEGAHVSNAERDITGKNTLVTSDNFQVRTGATADATFGTETVIGHTGTGQRNVRITDSLVALRSGTDNYLHFNTSSGTPYITIGKYVADEQNIDIRPTSIRFRTHGTTDAQIAYDSTNTTPQITLGRTGSNQKNVYITNTALQMRTATTVDASFGVTNTIGRTSGTSSNVYITSTALQLRKGTTPYINLTTDGVVEVGGTANKKVVITESTLTLQGGTRGSELFAPIKMEGWVTGSGTTAAPYKCLSEVVNGAWTMRSSYDYVTSQSSRGPQGTTCTETVLGWGRVYKTTLLQSLSSSSSMTERVFNLDSTNGVEIKPNMLDAGLTISWNGVMTTSDGNIIAPKVIASGGNMGQASVSVPNAAWTKVGTYTLAKGKYIVMCDVAWNSNATGIRRCGLNTASATEGGGWGWNAGMQAANGSPTVCQVQGVLNVSSQTTYYLNAYQNSGGALNCNPRWHCVKIG